MLVLALCAYAQMHAHLTSRLTTMRDALTEPIISLRLRIVRTSHGFLKVWFKGSQEILRPHFQQNVQNNS